MVAYCDTVMTDKIRIETVLPPEIVADLGTVINSGLSDEDIARNVKALLKTQERLLVRKGTTAGMVAEDLLKKNPSRKPRQ